MNHPRSIPLMHRLLCPSLLTFGLGALTGCLAPPSVAQMQAQNAAKVEKVSVAPTDFLDYTWADCSGADGKGGTQLTRSEARHTWPLRKDISPAKAGGDGSLKKHPKWMLYKGGEGKVAAFEWKWVTTEKDKFWGQMWGGGGIAFGGDWPNVDATGAKYLVFYAKISEPMPELDMGLMLGGKTDSGDAKTGKASINQFAEGKKVGTDWTRVVIPLKSIPDLNKVDLAKLQTVVLDLGGKFPENKPLWMRIDNVFFSDADMITPVENVGYLAMGPETLVVWDKDPGEKIKEFIVKVDGKEVARVPGDHRQAKVKIAVGAHKIVVQSASDKETSSPITIDAKIESAQAQAATVTVGQPIHEISRWVFGTNYASGEQMKDAKFSVTRWGGNGTSKYNWKNDLSSAGGDWFFLNTHFKPDGTPEEKKDYYKFIKEALDAGTEVNFSIAMLPWIAKPAPKEGDRLCGFPASAFPKQEKIGGEGCGNGKTPDGKDKIWDNDPSIAFIPNSPEFQKGLVENIKKLFGGAANKGVKFFELDNEPGLWRENHRDVYPKGYASEELAELSFKYGSMIKSVDPAAQVVGFSSWGVMECAGSNMDFMPPGPDGYKHYDQYKDVEKERWRDVKAHNGDPNLVTYLKTLRKLDGGKHVVDIVDIHWYPEVYYGGKRLSDNDIAFDPDIADKQFEALREFWDPTFKLADQKMDSWTANESLHKYLWDPFHPVIPALKKMIDQAYPGTKLAIDEYATGSISQYHGALLRAVTLGIFAQEDVFMAQNWYQTGKDNFTYWGQKLFTNFDGKGGHFAGKFVKSTSSSKDLYSFVAQDGGKTIVVLVNKNQKAPLNVSIKLPKAAKTAQVHTLTKTLGVRFLAGESKPAGAEVTVQIPAFSAEVVVLQ